MTHLITFAAWTCALATVLWQRALRPALVQAFPNFDELMPAAVAPAAAPTYETHESHPSSSAPRAADTPRRQGRSAPRRRARTPVS